MLRAAAESPDLGPEAPCPDCGVVLDFPAEHSRVECGGCGKAWIADLWLGTEIRIIPAKETR